MELEEDELEFYGKYKAKLSEELWERIQGKAGWKVGACNRDQSDAGR